MHLLIEDSLDELMKYIVQDKVYAIIQYSTHLPEGYIFVHESTCITSYEST